MNPHSHLATSSSHLVHGQIREIIASVALYTFRGVLFLARLWHHWRQWRFLRQCWLPCCCVITNKWRLVHTHILPACASNTLSTLHKCNIHTLVKRFRSQFFRGKRARKQYLCGPLSPTAYSVEAPSAAVPL